MAGHWTPLTLREQVKVEKHPQYSGRVRITLQLSAAPPEDWRTYFNQPFPAGLSVSLSRPRPTCVVDLVRFDVPATAELDDYYADVRDRLRATNEWYVNTYLPELEATEKRRKGQEEADRLQIETVEARMKRLLAK